MAEENANPALPFPLELDYRPIARNPVVEREAEQEELAEEDPWLNVWAAAVGRQNPGVAYLQGQFWVDPLARGPEPTPGHNTFRDSAKLVEGYPPEAFRDSRSKAEDRQIVAEIDKQRKDEAMLARHGKTAFAGEIFGAGTAPSNVITGALAVPKNAVKAAMLWGGSEALNEAWLHTRQPERSQLETAMNITGATLLGAAVGEIAKRMKPGEMEASVKALNKDVVDDTLGDGATPSKSAGKSAGAAEFQDTTAKQEGMVKGIFNWLAPIAPGGEIIAKSASATAKRVATAIADMSYRRVKNEEGIATPSSMQVRALDADRDIGIHERAVDEQYGLYQKRGGRLSLEEFDIQITYAKENGNVHDIPEVVEASKVSDKFYAQTIEEAAEMGLYDPAQMRLLERAQQKALDEGLPMPKAADVLKNPNEQVYNPRIIDRKKLGENGVEARNIKSLIYNRMTAILTKSSKKRPKKHLYFVTDKADPMGRGVTTNPSTGKPNPVARGIYETLTPTQAKDMDAMGMVTRKIKTAKLDSETIKSQAKQITDDIMHNLRGGSALSDAELDFVVPKAGALHARELGFLSNQEIRATGILLDSQRAILRIQHKQMIRDIEWHRGLGAKGLDLDGIRAEYRELVETGKLSPRKAKRREARDIKILEAFKERYYGTRGLGDNPEGFMTQLFQQVQLFNNLSLLAASVFPNAADVFAPSLRHGFTPLARGMADVYKVGAKLSHEEAQLAGLAMEGAFGRQMAARHGGGQGSAPLLPEAIRDRLGVEADTRDANRFMTKWFGLNMMSDVAQTVSYFVASKQIKELSGNWSKLAKKDKMRLLEIGIDERIAGHVTEQLKLHGSKKPGSQYPHTEKWKAPLDKNGDPTFDMGEIVREYDAAIRRDVLRSAQFDDIANRPLAFDDPHLAGIGKLFGQFQSFVAMSTQNFLVAGMQRADAEFLAGFVAVSMLGGMIGTGRDVLRGRDISEKNAVSILIDGFDRGGVGGYAALGLAAGWSVLSDDPTSRFFLRSPWQIAMGPGPEPLWRLISGMKKIATGEGDFDDAHRAARRLPFGGWLHIMDGLRLINDGVGYSE